MSARHNPTAATAVAVAIPTPGQRLARWIDDPFASVIVGIVMPAIAAALVLSGIGLVGIVV